MQSSRIVNIRNEIIHHKKVADLAKEINSLFEALDKFKKVGWPTGESVAIMGEVNNLARKHSVEILTFNPGDFNELDSYSTLSMILNLRADYFSLVRFLSELEELETLTKVSVLQITPEGSTSQDDGPPVRANLTIYAFILKR